MCQTCNNPADPPHADLLSRRRFLLSTGALLTLAACGGETASPPAPSASTRPLAPRIAVPDLGTALFPDPQGRPIAPAASAPVPVLPRSAWTHAKPDFYDIHLMGPVERITVHHTARSFKDHDQLAAAAEIESIRLFHTTDKDRLWADIAYHFILDPAGRAWQARPLVYQGSHAKDNNEHNLGIALLGDFAVQHPSAIQLNALAAFIRFARVLYRIPTCAIHTHGELKQTDCPGRFLQAQLNFARARWALEG